MAQKGTGCAPFARASVATVKLCQRPQSHVRMDIFFCSAVRATGAQRCSRTPGCLLGLLTAGQTSHHITAPQPAVPRFHSQRVTWSPAACAQTHFPPCLPQREGVSAFGGRLSQRSASGGSGRASLVFSLVWNTGRKQRTATPPTEQGEARINNFATAAAAASAPIKRAEERRRADTHRPREDCRCDPTEELTKGELRLPPLSANDDLSHGVWLEGYGALRKRNKVVSEGRIALFCRERWEQHPSCSALSAYFCMCAVSQSVMEHEMHDWIIHLGASVGGKWYFSCFYYVLMNLEHLIWCYSHSSLTWHLLWLMSLQYFALSESIYSFCSFFIRHPLCCYPNSCTSASQLTVEVLLVALMSLSPIVTVIDSG